MKAGMGLAALAAATVMLTGAARAQDVAAGEQSFKKCLPCHSIGEGAKNKVGPELNGLDGRKSGTAFCTMWPRSGSTISLAFCTAAANGRA
jgi:cytochrome c2